MLELISALVNPGVLLQQGGGGMSTEAAAALASGLAASYNWRRARLSSNANCMSNVKSRQQTKKFSWTPWQSVRCKLAS